MKKHTVYYSFILVVLFTLSSCVSSKGINVKKVDDDFESASENVLNHSDWDELLKKYVTKTGFVDYKGFKSDREKLTEYITYLSEQKPNKVGMLLNNWHTL